MIPGPCWCRSKRQGALRVNISLDEGLLARIDDVSKRTGLSRSALLARGARMVIATELNP
jgi:metal-responsive CopG/Arc/MetJ family transcriptional regulator